VTRARELLGADRWIGYSAHSAEEAGHAAEVGADYVIAGTIFRSVTHADSAPAGVELITDLARSAKVPVLAIGGIDESRVRACVAAGAWGVAVIRAVWSAREPIVAAEALLAELEGQL
jgi:thiamine-phosphate pyrophosphorylase